MNDGQCLHWLNPILAHLPCFTGCLSPFNSSSPRGVYRSGSSNSASWALTWCSLHPDFCTGVEVAPYCEVQNKIFTVASTCRVPQIWILFFFPPWFPFCQALLIASIRSILTSDRSHHIFSLASVLPLYVVSILPVCGPNSPWRTHCYVVNAVRVHKEEPVTAALLSCFLIIILDNYTS